MRIIDSVREMQQQADDWRRQGRRIALVPTMGFLHEGHLALMRKALTLGDVTVVSIFVNPTQFGPGEDFERYPRDPERDFRMIEEVGVDAVFCPTAEAMYPQGYQTFVEVTEVSGPLCGERRPGHFRGVATVVAKLFNIVKPHAAVFGEKDFQQLVVIRRMVRDLNMDVEVVGHPTVREADGLAMSSRNIYLSEDERRDALKLSQALKEAAELVDADERRAEVILERVRDVLQSGRHVRIDYAELREPDSLRAVSQIDGPTLLALAAHVGKARLIDNRVLNPA
jgi:pantoate--beta-alanine ligase